MLKGKEFKDWKSAAGIVDSETKITETVSYTAKYTVLDDIIPEPDPEKPIVPPAGYVLVDFEVGTNGNFVEGTVTRYYVNPDANKTLSDISKPGITANSGFDHSGWDKTDGTVITEKMTVTATYTEKGFSVKPVINQVKVGDTTITGTCGVPGATLEVELPDRTKLLATIDYDGNWTADVPTGVTLADGDVINATQTEPGKAPTKVDEVTVTAEPTLGKIEKPKVNPVTTDDNTITGEGIPGATINVRIPGENPILLL